MGCFNVNKTEGALQIGRHVSDDGVYWEHMESIFNMILRVTVGRVGQQKSWFLDIHKRFQISPMRVYIYSYIHLRI